MIPLPDDVDTLDWLLDIEYQDGAVVRHSLWTDNDATVTVGSDVYMPAEGVIEAVTGFNEQSTTPDRRPWQVSFNDPQRTFKRRYQSNWRGKKGVISMRTDGVVRRWKSGVVIGRQFVSEERRNLTRLVFADMLNARLSTRKRFMNPKAQRLVDSTDDSLDQAQKSVDVDWGI